MGPVVVVPGLQVEWRRTKTNIGERWKKDGGEIAYKPHRGSHGRYRDLLDPSINRPGGDCAPPGSVSTLPVRRIRRVPTGLPRFDRRRVEMEQTWRPLLDGWHRSVGAIPPAALAEPSAEGVGKPLRP